MSNGGRKSIDAVVHRQLFPGPALLGTREDPRPRTKVRLGWE